MKTKLSKEYQAAWATVLDNLTLDQQELVLAAPEGRASAAVAMHAERLMEARQAAKGKGAGPERQLMERLESENPLS